MCTYKYIIKKSLSGVVGTTTGMIIGRLNKLAGVATGAAATVATDLGLDWLESKIELEIARRCEDIGDNFDFAEFDFNEVSDADVVGETTTVETTTVETTTVEKAEEKKEVKNEPEKLSPLEEDKKKARELKLDELDAEKEETPKGAPATNGRLNPTTRK